VPPYTIVGCVQIVTFLGLTFQAPPCHYLARGKCPQRKGKKMAQYPVRTVYYFDQVVEADTAEQAMLLGGDFQPSEHDVWSLGLTEIDRTAESEPVS